MLRGFLGASDLSGPRVHYSRIRESSTSVTGPSFTSDTFMSAPNSPEAISLPRAVLICRRNVSHGLIHQAGLVGKNAFGRNLFCEPLPGLGCIARFNTQQEEKPSCDLGFNFAANRDVSRADALDHRAHRWVRPSRRSD